ncbi:MAG: addiction module protein [Spirochaetales bacterium]|nr:addiction module protein [Spirochaetales bacterium]
MTVQEIKAAALTLTAHDRIELADALYTSVDPSPIYPELGAILDRRLAEIESGQATSISLPELLQKCDAVINATPHSS